MTSGASRGGPRRPSPRGQGPGTRGRGKEDGASPPAQSLPQLRKQSRCERPSWTRSGRQGAVVQRDLRRAGTAPSGPPPGAPSAADKRARVSPRPAPPSTSSTESSTLRAVHKKPHDCSQTVETQETGCPGLGPGPWLQACPCSRGPWPTRGARRPRCFRVRYLMAGWLCRPGGKP